MLPTVQVLSSAGPRSSDTWPDVHSACPVLQSHRRCKLPPNWARSLSHRHYHYNLHKGRRGGGSGNATQRRQMSQVQRGLGRATKDAIPAESRYPGFCFTPPSKQVGLN